MFVALLLPFFWTLREPRVDARSLMHTAAIETQAGPPSDSSLFAAERSIWDAYRAHSRRALAELLAPSFRNVDSGGEATRADILGGLDEYVVARVDVQLLQIVKLSPTTFLVRCRVRVQHAYDGKSLPGDLTTSTIWEAGHSGLQAVFHQETVRT